MCCARGCSSKKCFEKDQVFQRCWMSANRWAPRSEKFSCEYAQRSVQNHRSKHDKARRPFSPTSWQFDRALIIRQNSADARTGRPSFLIHSLSAPQAHSFSNNKLVEYLHLLSRQETWSVPPTRIFIAAFESKCILWSERFWKCGVLDDATTRGGGMWHRKGCKQAFVVPRSLIART